MKPSIAIYSVGRFFAEKQMNVKGFIEYAAKLGLEGVDLGYYWAEDKKEKEQEMRNVPTWLKDNGIVLSGYIVGNGFSSVVGTPAVKDEIAKVKTAIDEANQLGAKVLRVFAGHADNLTFEKGAPLVADCFAECTAYAAKKNVILALEDHGGLASNSKECLYYVNKINSPFFKINVDIGNFTGGGEDPIVGVTKTAAYAVMVHVKDLKKTADGFEACPVGEGFIDFTKCFQILKDAGYNGFASLEYEAAEDAWIGIEKSVKHMKKCMAQLK